MIKECILHGLLPKLLEKKSSDTIPRSGEAGMAKAALDNGTELPERYWKMGRWWFIFGSLAFPTIVVVFRLMVYRPT